MPNSGLKGTTLKSRLHARVFLQAHAAEGPTLKQGPGPRLRLRPTERCPNAKSHCSNQAASGTLSHLSSFNCHRDFYSLRLPPMPSTVPGTQQVLHELSQDFPVKSPATSNPAALICEEAKAAWGHTPPHRARGGSLCRESRVPGCLQGQFQTIQSPWKRSCWSSGRSMWALEWAACSCTAGKGATAAGGGRATSYGRRRHPRVGFPGGQKHRKK